MKQRTFMTLLILIVGLGFFLRLNDYDRTPAWHESNDEIHYAWAGLTWITTGTPTSWSWLSSYPTSEMRSVWGSQWRLVTPMLEKPPLYSFLSGGLLYATGARDLEDVQVTITRLLPLALGACTLLLIGLVGAKLLDRATGLLAAMLYAITPTFVLASRLSVTENLITPIALLTILVSLIKFKKWHYQAIFLGILAGLAALTKQSGLTVLVIPLIFYGLQKKWRAAGITTTIAMAFYALYPLIGLLYDKTLFLHLMAEGRRIGIQGGLPQVLLTIVGRPLITTEIIFPDGLVFLGELLLLTCPLWLKNLFPETNKKIPLYTFLSFPFAYIVYLAVFTTGAEPIGSGQGFWGWYVYPLFPFAALLVAAVFAKLWRELSFLLLLPTVLILGSSSIRFALLFLPRAYHYRWQMLLVGLLVGSALTWLKGTTKTKRYVLGILLVGFILLSSYTAFAASLIYPTLSQ